MERATAWNARATVPAKPPCTLLVPASLEEFLRWRYRQHGPVIAYLAFLLGRASIYRDQGRLPGVERVTRRYQAENRSLQRWHVRVPGELWTQLRCLAGASGVTMSHMFVILVELDQEDQDTGRNDGAPTFWGAKVSFLEGVGYADGVTRRKIRYITTPEAPPRLLRLIRGRTRPLRLR